MKELRETAKRPVKQTYILLHDKHPRKQQLLCGDLDYVQTQDVMGKYSVCIV
jgi:hypothetical protein